MAGELNLSSPMDGPIDCVRLAVCVCACLPLLRGGGACQSLARADGQHGPPSCMARRSRITLSRGLPVLRPKPYRPPTALSDPGAH
jgi:hypothetical protein